MASRSEADLPDRRPRPVLEIDLNGGCAVAICKDVGHFAACGQVGAVDSVLLAIPPVN